MPILDFLWWNTHNFAHFDPTRSVDGRWPQTVEAYANKCERVDEVLRRIIAMRGEEPALIGLGEVTRIAATDLRDRMFQGYAVHSLDLIDNDPDFHIAVLYRHSAGLAENVPLATPLTPPSTRPMAVVDFAGPNDLIRFIFCHWTARFGLVQGDDTRHKILLYLQDAIWNFLHDETATQPRHVVVIGDLNVEPYGFLEDHYHFSRSHKRATQQQHHMDVHVHRTRLYNCAWRWVGEYLPHAGNTYGRASMPGTHYYHEQRRWATFDHIIVTGGLLTDEYPMLCEEAVGRFMDDSLIDEQGILAPFEWRGGDPVGVSDHVPILGRIQY